jgi:ABC-type transport system involved in cytochrome bd biosynthesis fused ATPase/permease subunit
MIATWRRIARWLGRARPDGATLSRALLAGTASTATGLALFIGAPYLLYFSVAHGHFVAGSTLAILLVAIELLAFLRSPARYLERVSGHELGVGSVIEWRRWLTVAIGRWTYSRWVRAATGDLLERAISDTDALQDLWLRGVVPMVAILASLIGADVVVAAMNGSTLAAAGVLALVQLTAVILGVVVLPAMVSRERAARLARAARTVARLEVQDVTAELALLGVGRVVEERLAAATDRVERAEARHDRGNLAVAVLLVAIAVGAVPLVAWLGSITSLSIGEQIVIALTAMATAELAAIERASLGSLTTVAAACERLDALETPDRYRREPWPDDAGLDVGPLSFAFGQRTVLENAEMVLAPGARIAITGANGSGKSMLLRLLARLEEPTRGEVRVGPVDLVDVDESALRAAVGYVPADPQLLDGVVGVVMRLGRSGEVDVEGELAALGLHMRDSDRFVRLSRGEAQRAALARALLGSPELLLLDEPTSGLGPSERRLVIERLSRCGASIVVATHDEALIAHCDARLELSSGRLSPARL